MNDKTFKIEKLDQYDYVDDEYIQVADHRYSDSLGLFLIRFSFLEHNLNLILVGIINERAHDMGYQVIESLTMKNKIELFVKLYLQWASFNCKKHVEWLKKIKNKLNEINNFRNIVVHANWSTLTKEKFVRSKIMTDNEEGYIKFKLVKITPKIIKDEIKKIEATNIDLDKFVEAIEEYNKPQTTI